MRTMWLLLTMQFSYEEYWYAVVSGRIVKLDENQSNTIQGTKSEMEHKQFINDEIEPVIFYYKRTA